jgi:hypothetical protein
LVTCALVRAPELQNAEIKEHFSRKRVLVNSASTPHKIFEILKKIETESFLEIRLQSWSKNAKLDGKTFFAKRMWVFGRTASLVTWYSQYICFSKLPKSNRNNPVAMVKN